MTEPATTHTIDEALAKFQLIGGSAGDPAKDTACVMTALSWVAGESWSDHPRCAHTVLANLAIRTNDHDDTTEDERAEIVRAGATGLIDTWWLPGEVVAWCISEGMKAAELPVERCLATLAAVDAWRAAKQRPDLTDAYLTRAYLTDADLTGAYLTGANLTRANLTRANLTGADLAGAYLTGANLAGANLTGAYLTDADLAGANLTGAYLTGANLTGAYLAGANLTGANLTGAKCNEFTVPPAGWTVNKATWRLEREAVDAHEQASTEVEAVPA